MKVRRLRYFLNDWGRAARQILFKCLEDRMGSIVFVEVQRRWERGMVVWLGFGGSGGRVWARLGSGRRVNKKPA